MTDKSQQLGERAKTRTADAALIQNGNDPDRFNASAMTARDPLGERAKTRTADAALVQNGNDPEHFNASAMTARKR